MKIKLICKNCNKEFDVFPSRKNRKFCSMKCSSEYIKKEKHHNYKKKIIKICENCGEKFKVHECRKDAKYCSVECANKIIAENKRKKRIQSNCLYCNKKYNVVFSQKRRTNYCSKECQYRHQEEKFKNKGNPNFGNYKYTEEQYKEWMKYRQAVRSKSYREYNKYKNIINPFNLKLGRWTYHLDHKYSIHDGFHNNIPVSIIANYKNLQILSCKSNLQKGIKSSVNLKELKAA